MITNQPSPPGDEAPRLRIDPARSRLGFNARPPLPGTRLEATGLDGMITAVGPPAGADSGAATVIARGQITFVLRAVSTDPSRPDEPDRAPIARVPPALTGPGTPVRGPVEVMSVAADRHRITVAATLTIAGRTVRYQGHGRVHRRVPGDDDADGTLEADGVTIVDPRLLGFALPLLVTHAVNVHWRITLVPFPGRGETVAAG